MREKKNQEVKNDQWTNFLKVVTYWLSYYKTCVKCNSMNNSGVHSSDKKKSFIEFQVPINLKSFLEIFNDFLMT